MPEEKVLLNATLCFLIKDDEILLALKTKKIGQGCWNGYGGGIDGSETPTESVLRELKEEAGVKALPQDTEKVAVIDFHNTKSDGTEFVCRVHIYFVRQWQGEARATEEMDQPTWFKKESLPLEKMMPADRQWLPLVLNGKKIIAKFHYGPFQKTLLSEGKIQFVNSFFAQ
jgi:8-oxo-dGTP diphosphatase